MARYHGSCTILFLWVDSFCVGLLFLYGPYFVLCAGDYVGQMLAIYGSALICSGLGAGYSPGVLGLVISIHWDVNRPTVCSPDQDDIASHKVVLHFRAH